MSGKFRELGFVVSGSLGAIIVVMICTESFLANDGAEQREAALSCLVNHISKKNVTFDWTKSSSDADCSEIVSQKNRSFYFDLEHRMNCIYSPYKVACDQCKVLNSSLFEVTRMNNTRSSCRQPGLLGSEIKTDATRDKEAAACINLTKCINCFIEKLAATDYETIRFHAAAVNTTIVEFKVWEYFSISHNAQRLLDQSKQLEDTSIIDCIDEKQCEAESKLCVEHRE